MSRYNPQSTVREYCLHSTTEFVNNLDTEDRNEFFEDYKNSKGKWINVSSTWVNFLRDYILVPSGCDAVADAICNEMMDFAENEDTVLDLLKELDGSGIDAESICSDEEDEDTPADRHAVVNTIYKTITSDDGNRTVLVELEDGQKEVPLSVFASMAMDYKFTPPNTIGNNGKWIWRKIIAGTDYEQTAGQPQFKISFA
jgi:hypothetical protein